MDSKELYSNLNLTDLGFISPNTLQFLGGFNIFTIGQLLSSTRGLTRTEVLNDQENKEELIRKLQQYIPEEILNEYRDFSEEHPTGLRKLSHNENKTENF
jgi:hypothetical protein